MWPPPLSRTSTIRPRCGSRPRQPDELVPERDRVLHAEGEDPQMPEGPGRRDRLAGPEHPGHRGRQIRAADRCRRPQLGRTLAAFQLDHVAHVERLLRPGLLVGVQVQTHRRGRLADRVQVRHRRKVGGHLPLLAQLLGRPVETDVGEVHPVLVRRRLDHQRPQGERLQTAREVGRVVAAGELRAVQGDGAGDRRTVPVRHLGAGAELRSREAGNGPGDQVVLLAGPVVSTSRS